MFLVCFVLNEVFLIVCCNTPKPQPTGHTSLFFSLSISSLLTGPLDCTWGPYNGNICKSLLVGRHWFLHVKESIIKRRLWVRSYFSSGTQHVLFVLRVWFVRWEAGVVGCRFQAHGTKCREINCPSQIFLDFIFTFNKFLFYFILLYFIGKLNFIGKLL